MSGFVVTFAAEVLLPLLFISKSSRDHCQRVIRVGILFCNLPLPPEPQNCFPLVLALFLSVNGLNQNYSVSVNG